MALLRTVGLIPGVRIDHGRDSKGRAAVIATLTAGAGRSELYPDPEDGTLLEERTVSTGNDGVAAGTVLYRSTLDVAGVVDGSARADAVEPTTRCQRGGAGRRGCSPGDAPQMRRLSVGGPTGARSRGGNRGRAAVKRRDGAGSRP